MFIYLSSSRVNPAGLSQYPYPELFIGLPVGTGVGSFLNNHTVRHKERFCNRGRMSQATSHNLDQELYMSGALTLPSR